MACSKANARATEAEILDALADLVVAGFKLGDLRLLATCKPAEKGCKV